MDARFRIEDDIQVVELKGRLTSTEGAAIRFKIEEKLNQGRNKLALDLSGFELTDAQSLESIHLVLQYGLNRRARIACLGVPVAQWPLLVLPDERRPLTFSSWAECRHVLAQEAAAPIAGEGDDEEKIKNRALEDLLKSYEIYQHNQDLDPFRLGFLASRLEEGQPLPETAQTLSRAKEELKELELQNTALNDECEAKAKILNEHVLKRRQPQTAVEFQRVITSLQQQISECQIKQSALEKQILEKKQKIQSFADEQKKLKDQLAQELLDLNAEIQEASS